MAKRKKPLWERDEIQFPRLLAEIDAVGLTEDQYKALGESMDLTRGDINDLLERAETAWDAHKERLFKRQKAADLPKEKS